MTLAEHFRAMARNNAYANHRLLSACEGLSEEAFAAPRVSFFPSLKETLNHNLSVDRYYIGALTADGRGLSMFDDDPIAAPAALREAQAAQDRRLIAHCDRLDEAACDAPVETDRGAAGVLRERTGDVLAHLFQHQIHHRGQAHAMLAGTAVAPPQLDEFFLAFDRHPIAARYGEQ